MSVDTSKDRASHMPAAGGPKVEAGSVKRPTDLNTSATPDHPREAETKERASYTEEESEEESWVRGQSRISGQWELSPMVSLDPTPVQELTDPRRDLLLETIGAVKDEITIGFIANGVLTALELSPEPDAVVNSKLQYDDAKGAEMLRQVEEDCARQTEEDHRKEEERMLTRVLKEAEERREDSMKKVAEKTGEPELKTE